MKNLLIIYNRELFLSLKKRKMILCLTVLLISFSLIFLLILNYIIIDIKTKTEIDYNLIKIFIHIGETAIIMFSTIVPMLFFSTSINSDKKNMNIENLLNTNITKKDIVLGKYIKGVFSSITLLFSLLPIFYLSIMFGGIDINNIIKIILLAIFLILFASSVYLYISSIFYEINTAVFVSIFISIFLSLAIILYLTHNENNLNHILVLLFMSILTIIFLKLTMNSKIFRY